MTQHGLQAVLLLRGPRKTHLYIFDALITRSKCVKMMKFEVHSFIHFTDRRRVAMAPKTGPMNSG